MAVFNDINFVDSASVTWSAAAVPLGGSVTATAVVGTTDTFSVKVNANQANQTGDGTAVVVPFDTVIFDSASGFNTTTHLYTFPRTKAYQINTAIFCYSGTAADTSVIIRALINGTTEFRLFEVNLGATQTPGQEIVLSGGVLINATAGQTLSITCQVSGSTKTVGLAGTFCVLNGYSVN